MLDLNITLLIQLANFLVTVYVLNILLIRPIRKVIRDRKALTDGLADEAGGLDRQAKDSLQEYMEVLTKARREGAANMAAGRASGQKTGQELLDGAQNEALDILGTARARLKTEGDQALTELRAQVGGMSSRLAARILNG